MVFRVYTNVVRNASRSVAAAVLAVGLVLIGFGFLIFLLPRLFATLAAMVFFVLGVGFSATAVRIFLAQRRWEREGRAEWGDEPYDQMHIRHETFEQW